MLVITFCAAKILQILHILKYKCHFYAFVVKIRQGHYKIFKRKRAKKRLYAKEALTMCEGLFQLTFCFDLLYTYAASIKDSTVITKDEELSVDEHFACSLNGSVFYRLHIYRSVRTAGIEREVLDLPCRIA